MLHHALEFAAGEFQIILQFLQRFNDFRALILHFVCATLPKLLNKLCFIESFSFQNLLLNLVENQVDHLQAFVQTRVFLSFSLIN